MSNDIAGWICNELFGCLLSSSILVRLQCPYDEDTFARLAILLFTHYFLAFKQFFVSFCSSFIIIILRHYESKFAFHLLEHHFFLSIEESWVRCVICNSLFLSLLLFFSLVNVWNLFSIFIHLIIILNGCFNECRLF